LDMGRSGGNRYQHALSIFLEIVFGRIQFQANNLPQAQLGRNTLVTSHPRLFLVRLQYFLIPTLSCDSRMTDAAQYNTVGSPRTHRRCDSTRRKRHVNRYSRCTAYCRARNRTAASQPSSPEENRIWQRASAPLSKPGVRCLPMVCRPSRSAPDLSSREPRPTSHERPLHHTRLSGVRFRARSLEPLVHRPPIPAAAPAPVPLSTLQRTCRAPAALQPRKPGH
jgi:hypothetical protein